MYKIIGADQKEYGPVSADELRRWVAEGRANGQTLIQAAGRTDWRPLSTYPELSGLAAPAVAPFPTVAPANASSLVAGPAIAMMIVGIIFVVAAVLGVLGATLHWGADMFTQQRADLPPEVARIMQNMRGSSGTMAIVLTLMQLAASIFVIIASVKMRKMESYGLAMTASILIMVPCVTPFFICIPCCIIGLPIGIWSMVVLAKTEVKSAFR